MLEPISENRYAGLFCRSRSSQAVLSDKSGHGRIPK